MMIDMGQCRYLVTSADCSRYGRAFGNSFDERRDHHLGLEDGRPPGLSSRVGDGHVIRTEPHSRQELHPNEVQTVLSFGVEYVVSQFLRSAIRKLDRGSCERRMLGGKGYQLPHTRLGRQASDLAAQFWKTCPKPRPRGNGTSK